MIGLVATAVVGYRARMIEVLLHDAAGSDALREPVLDVWQQAFGPVDDASEWVETVWDRHRAREDYRLVTAEVDKELAGFAWGYTGRSGQCWPDLVRETLGDAVDGWVGGHFEFVELAVRPDRRRAGLGRRLHDRLLDGVPHRHGLLGTSADEQDPAVRLYRSRGWSRLGVLTSGAQVMGIADPGTLRA